MGSLMAYDLAEFDVSLEQQLSYHLRVNHYPPIPVSMVEPCIQAIDAYWDDDIDRQIPMPEGVSYKGLTSAPAWAVIQQHHLDAWTAEYDYDAMEDGE